MINNLYLGCRDITDIRGMTIILDILVIQGIRRMIILDMDIQ
ncbi:hypothetical protein [Proteiniphilum sp.]|nr:hypothetical protein [Proteiniphilum sp.]MEA4917695.1 hypothetical protein [Proteiniphilum sp.]